MTSEIIYDDDDGEARVRIYFARSESGGYLTETVNGGESNRFYLPEAALIALLARDDARIARLEDVVRDLRHAALQVVEFDEGEDGSDLDASHLFSIRIETLADCIDVLDALDADAPGTTEQEKN